MLIVEDEDAGDSLGVINTAGEGAVVRVAKVLFKLVARVSVGTGGRAGTPARRGVSGSRREGGRGSGHCKFVDGKGGYCGLGGKFGGRKVGSWVWAITR